MLCVKDNMLTRIGLLLFSFFEFVDHYHPSGTGVIIQL